MKFGKILLAGSLAVLGAFSATLNGEDTSNLRPLEEYEFFADRNSARISIQYL